MIKDVNVTIDLQKIVGKEGVGFPLIVFNSTDADVDYAEANIADITETAVLSFIETICDGDNPPEKVAIMGVKSTTAADIVEALKGVVEKNWRSVVLIDFKDKENSQAIIDYINTTDKMLFMPLCVIPTTIDYAKYSRLVAVCGKDTTDFDTAITNIATVFGGTCGLAAGSFTYKNTVVNNGAVMSNSDYKTAVATETIPPFLAILEKAGSEVISDACTVSGDFIDVIDSKDYIINSLEYETQKLLNNQKKLPYTNNGVAMLESVAVNVLQSAYNNGMIADNEDGSPAFSVSYELKEDATAENIQDRKYIGGNFDFVLSGAIHTVKINGVIKYV